MNITGITLGINEPHYTCAQRACQEVKKVLNIDSRIITEEYIKLGVGNTELEKIWSLKLQIFDIFPDLDNVMFFDTDWRPLKYFNVLECCPDHNKAYFAPDRSNYWFIQDLEKQYGLAPGTYVNVGWFVVNRKLNNLFKECVQNFLTLPKSFYAEQCVINQIFKNNINLVDPRINVLDLHTFPLEEIIGLHNKETNYKFYNVV